jgi:hypothetical protein
VYHRRLRHFFLNIAAVLFFVLPLAIRSDALDNSARTLARWAALSHRWVWVSVPATLDAPESEDRRKIAEANLRETHSPSLDWATMASVLLRKKAKSSGSLLPQWLSGYPFLLSMVVKVDRCDSTGNAPGGELSLRLIAWR